MTRVGRRAPGAPHNGVRAAIGLLVVAASALTLALAVGGPGRGHLAATRARRPASSRVAAHLRTSAEPSPAAAGTLTATRSPAAVAPSGGAGVLAVEPPHTGDVPPPPPAPPAGAAAAVPSAPPGPVSAAAPQGTSTLTGVPSGWAVSSHTLAAGGLARSYLLARPATRGDRPLPVVVILHGREMTAAAIERASGLLGVLGPAIAVFPSGYDESWDAGSCCGAAFAAHVDDVSFLEAVVHEVVRTQPDAAASRVFLVGYSNGGRMAMRMACADPGAFAGVAAVEAVPAAPCAAMTPLPTLLVASAGDPLLTIPSAGTPKVIQGWVEPTVSATVAGLQQLDGCRGSGAVEVAGVLTSTSWSTCSGAGRLEYDLYQGGSHRWPRGGAATPAAQNLIARFLLGSSSSPR